MLTLVRRHQTADLSPWFRQIRRLPHRAALQARREGVFVFGFPKSAQDNMRDDEEEQFKKAAKVILALSDEQLLKWVEGGQLEEVSRNGEEVSK